MAALCVCILTQVLLLLCPGALDACKQGLDVTTPNPVQALSGSCLQIPCNFTPASFDISETVVGVWMSPGHDFGSHPDYVIYKSSLSDNTYPMNITGDLRKRDCTTLFNNLTTKYTDIYYFRIENGPDKATAICNPLQIKVFDSAWSPSLEVSGVQTETEVVTITCSAATPCPQAPPILTWDLDQDTVPITETNSDRTLKTTLKQNITLTDSHDGLLINCSAVYPVRGGVKMVDSNITLSVSYGPKDTSVRVSPSGSLSAGQTVTLSCSSRAKPPVHNFTWFRHSSEGPVSLCEGDTFSFNLTEDGDYFCVASNGVRNESSSVEKLRIQETIPPIAIYLPWEVILGAGIPLLIVPCLAVFVWYFRSKRQASRETQGELSQPDKAAEEEDCINYGEIDFSKFNPKAAPATEQEETVYSEVQVSKPGATQQTEDLNELYANVKK